MYCGLNCRYKNEKRLSMTVLNELMDNSDLPNACYFGISGSGKSTFQHKVILSRLGMNKDEMKNRLGIFIRCSGSERD